jgi:superfamily II DNA/RNA helicase
MTKEERDDCIKKFREGSINVIIATNVLSRGFDMHTIKLVINFDVPSQRKNDILVPDYESY